MKERRVRLPWQPGPRRSPCKIFQSGTASPTYWSLWGADWRLEVKVFSHDWLFHVKFEASEWGECSPSSSSDSLWLASSLCLSKKSYWHSTITKKKKKNINFCHENNVLDFHLWQLRHQNCIIDVHIINFTSLFFLMEVIPLFPVLSYTGKCGSISKWLLHYRWYLNVPLIFRGQTALSIRLCGKQTIIFLSTHTHTDNKEKSGNRKQRTISVGGEINREPHILLVVTARGTSRGRLKEVSQRYTGSEITNESISLSASFRLIIVSRVYFPLCNKARALQVLKPLARILERHTNCFLWQS